MFKQDYLFVSFERDSGKVFLCDCTSLMPCPYCSEKLITHSLSPVLLITNPVLIAPIGGAGCVGTDLYQCADCKNYWYIDTEEYINLKISGQLISPAIAAVVQSGVHTDAAELQQLFKTQGYREQTAMRILFPEVKFLLK